MYLKNNEKRTKIVVIPHFVGKGDDAELIKRVIIEELRKESEKST